MIYELMYIIPANFSDTEIGGIIENVTGLLEKSGAKVEQTNNLGKIKFTYPIKKVRHGTYILSYFELEEKDQLKRIEVELKHTDEVLRHLYVKREEGIPQTNFEIKSYQSPLTPEGKRIHSRERVVEKTPAPPAEKISEEQLGKKLDEILEDDLSEKI